MRAPARVIAECREALRLNPRDPFAWTSHTLLGIAEMQLADYSAALDAFDVARRLPNVNWKPSLAASVAALALGQLEKAHSMLDQARALSPALTIAMLEHGMRAFALPPLAELAERLIELGVSRQ